MSLLPKRARLCAPGGIFHLGRLTKVPAVLHCSDPCQAALPPLTEPAGQLQHGSCIPFMFPTVPSALVAPEELASLCIIGYAGSSAKPSELSGSSFVCSVRTGWLAQAKAAMAGRPSRQHEGLSSFKVRCSRRCHGRMCCGALRACHSVPTQGVVRHLSSLHAPASTARPAPRQIASRLPLRTRNVD